MKINSISERTIPTFWAFVLLSGLIGVFIVDSYSGNRQEKIFSEEHYEKSQLDNSEGIIFTGSGLSFSELQAGEEVEMICHYDNNLKSESEIKAEVFFTKESGEKYHVFSAKTEKLTRGEGRVKLNFKVPPYLFAGDYSGLIRIYTLPTNEYRGGCGLPQFNLISESELIISELLFPETEESLMTVLGKEEREIIFEVRSFVETGELKPVVTLSDLLTGETVFEKKLEPASLSVNEGKRIGVQLMEFDMLGAYRVRLSLYEKNSLVAISPHAVLYFGQRPQVARLDVSRKESTYEFKIDYSVKPEIIDKLIEVLIVVRDSQGRECGFNRYSLFDVWPESFETKRNFDCDESEVAIAFKPKGEDKYLEIFKKEF